VEIRVEAQAGRHGIVFALDPFFACAFSAVIVAPGVATIAAASFVSVFVVIVILLSVLR